MKKAKAMIRGLIFLFLLFQLIAIMSREPSRQLIANEGVFCDSGSQYYCWTSLPYWECRTKLGGYRCADPIKK